MLNELDLKEKHGIDINPADLEMAKSLGIKTYDNLDDLPDNYFGKIISNNTLEHVPNFHDSLKKLRSRLKNNGIFIYVIPHENLSIKYDPEDINFHLYTFNQQVIGNSFKYCDYKIIDIKVLQYQWPSDYEKTYQDDKVLEIKKIFSSIKYYFDVIDKNSK